MAEGSFTDAVDPFGGTLDDGRFKWKSDWHKKLAYAWGYSSIVYPFDDPCDDCIHWFRERVYHA